MLEYIVSHNNTITQYIALRYALLLLLLDFHTSFRDDVTYCITVRVVMIQRNNTIEIIPLIKDTVYQIFNINRVNKLSLENT